LPRSRRRGAPHDRRPAAEARGGHTRWCLHRAHRPREAGVGLVDGERSRPAARRARRAIHMSGGTEMTTGTETTPKRLMALSGEELVKLIDLVGSADSVELKATLTTGEQQQAMTALGLDPLDAQIRQVFFFDTPDLQLNKAGVVLRARRIKGRDGDAI